MVQVPVHGRPEKKAERNKRFLIFCGGIVTEVEYFEYVKSVVGRYCSPGWNVQEDVQVEKKGVDPLTLTEDAITLMRRDAQAAQKEEYEPYERVWVVTDIDDFAKKIQQAQDAADATGGKVELVISNPCFEVWIIDHAESCPAEYTQTPMCQQLAKELDLVGNASGRRNKHIQIDKISGKYAEALEHARQHMCDSAQRELRQRHPAVNNQSNYAPWTDVPRVVEALIEECKRVSGRDISSEL